ncbi:MAG: hypothetical protein KJ600_01530 [Nanoarchaeota archaeon]|nr:hypothetical protein [Nanoarchaeota archaeon]
MKRITTVLLVAFIFLPMVSASYISGDIYLYENGETRFNIETDVPLDIEGLTSQNNKITGTTSDLITLQKGTWSFYLVSENYDDIFLDIHFPSSLSSITEVSGAQNIIYIDNKIMTIIDSGQLDFSLSYKLKQTTNYSWVIWLILIAAVAIIYLIIKRLRKRKERLEHILPLISDQEKKILDLLMKKSMRQKEIRKQLDIPKASFSRYIANLEKKKLILREGEGKNKTVKLK